MPNILVVEDDENLNRGITFSLQVIIMWMLPFVM